MAAVLFALAALMTLGVSSAYAALGTTLTVTPSTNAAGAHPDLGTTFDFSGTTDVKSLTLTLPNGLRIAPGAVASPCSLANVISGNCDSSTKVGTISAAATGAVTASGDLFLTDPPDSASVAGIAFRMNVSGGAGQVASIGALDLNLNGPTMQAQHLSFSSLPNVTSNGSPIHFTQLQLAFTGATGGSSHPLVTNPSSCPATPQNVSASAVAYDNSSAQSVTAYPVTSCGMLTVSPFFEESFSSPTAGTATNANFSFSLPAGSSSVKGLVWKLPDALGWNYPAVGEFTDQCPNPGSQTIFDASVCPPQAKVGTVTLTTPLFNGPVVGSVYLVAHGWPWLGFELRNSAGLRIAGYMNSTTEQVDPSCDPAVEAVCKSRYRFTATNGFLSDIPITRFEVQFGQTGRLGSNGFPLSDKIFAFEGAPCTAPGTSQLTMNPWSGTTFASVVEMVGIYSCRGFEPPDTGVFGPMSPTSSATPQIEFYGSDAFQCRLDGGIYFACSSPYTVGTPLVEGAHTFVVRSITVGGPDPTPAAYAFIVDTIAPLPPAISAPAAGEIFESTPISVAVSGEPG
ncbi:MAG: hypothetical protein Q7R41_05695, partial [Phycisphaerales bacterium]|nr:hypothetical protein [Phycisphaerales bacterium]